MNLPLIVRPEAEQDLLAAQAWYEERKVGLGDEFAEQVSSVFDQLAANATLFPIHWQDVRVCRLRRFPFVVYYRALTDHIEILAVLHGSRDSSAWRSRT